MSYAIAGRATSPSLDAVAQELARALERAGFQPSASDEPSDADLVVNLVDQEAPRAFRRKAKGTYSATLYELQAEPENVLKSSYPLLVRSLANIVMLYVPGQAVWFTTMERGTYRVEPELWGGDEVTEDIKAAGKRMGDLDLLPAPFPIEELLDERDLRHVMRLYGVGGLSYGNLSARLDANRFWMSASGVDKSQLDGIGRDILLVSGYDDVNGRMVISVPPGVEPRRVSVDAIEHWMIYQAHPDVGAILHVHAWVEGIAATQINYPCGTEELARSVAELIDQEPDPAHAVIGLRNHGITATGNTLAEILDRIEPRVLRQVPMN